MTLPQIKLLDRSSISEYELFAAVQNEVWPQNQETASELQHTDQTHDKTLFHERYFMQLDGRAVGVASMTESRSKHVAGKYFVLMSVLPAYRGRNIGSACQAFILAHVETRGKTVSVLNTMTREDFTHSVRYMARHGFQLDKRYPRSLLDVQAFDFAPYAAFESSFAARSLTICSLAEVSQAEPEWKQKFWQLWEHDILPDVPATDPYTPASYEQFSQHYFGREQFNPHSIFIALDGDSFVGVSVLDEPSSYHGTLEVGLTGVISTHRRQGIARALKLATIRHAQAYGAERIETDNEEENPMFVLNLELGFQPAPAWVGYRKHLGER